MTVAVEPLRHRITVAEYHQMRAAGIFAEDARRSIVEAWLVGVNARRVEIYREPSPTGYRTVLVRGEQDRMAPLALPEVEIALGKIWEREMNSHFEWGCNNPPRKAPR